jgi:hypothetical protein
MLKPLMAVLLAASAAVAVGEDLGKLSANPYDAESISNPNGRYGSPYSAESINNPNAAGSRYRADSDPWSE